MHKSFKTLVTAGLTAAVISVAGPAAAGTGGHPQDGGGCHMVTAPSSTGLSNMMIHASVNGATRMVDMLSLFSDKQFCGI